MVHVSSIYRPSYRQYIVDISSIYRQHIVHISSMNRPCIVHISPIYRQYIGPCTVNTSSIYRPYIVNISSMNRPCIVHVSSRHRPWYPQSIVHVYRPHVANMWSLYRPWFCLDEPVYFFSAVAHKKSAERSPSRTARGSTADNLRRARTALGFQTRAKRAVWGNFPRARTAHGSTMKKLPHSCAARVFILLWSRAIAHGFSHKRKRCRRAWLAHGFYQEGHFFFRVAHGPLSTFSPVATISRPRQ